MRYADDIALLAPCPSAMRTMLSVCEEHAVTHGLKFNPDKTKLIRFRSQSTCMYHDRISLVIVLHLGHLLSYNLDDTPDIIRVTKYLNRKANFVLCTFKSADPFVKCFLSKAYCLSLYDCTLWSLSCKLWARFSKSQTEEMSDPTPSVLRGETSFCRCSQYYIL